MDIYLLEAIINGILLGGVLALLALGLNLIFGVIDVVWIAYADLVMCGMYMVYWLYAGFGWPLLLACAVAIAGVAVLGVLVHVLIIAPILGSAPINQLLATGGLLFFLQSFATLLFGTDFRNLGIRLPIIELGEIYISTARLLAFAIALVGAVALYFFLKRTFIGTAIRAIAQDRDIVGLMGVDQRRIYLVTSAIGGALAGLASCLLVAAVRRSSLYRQHVRPAHFHDLRARRARRHDRRLRRRLHHQPDHLDRRLLHQHRARLCARLCVLHRPDVRAPARDFRAMNARHATLLAGLAILLCVPYFTPTYFLHLLIQALIWGFIYTAWSMMGRFGFVSLGHGAFMGVGAYVPALLWNYYDVTPWAGIPLGVLLSALLALVIGYPCFRFRVVGHYFALVTLALSQVVMLSIIAARDITGGSLGFTPRAVGNSWYALQFSEKSYFYVIALVLWLGGLAVWRWIDRGIGREALDAISEDEEAAASIGIDVMREKLRVTVISAALTALGGAIYGQYFMYLNPETVSGISVSLQIVFAAIVGGMYDMLGPTAGALVTISLNEGLRVGFGTHFIGAANTIYGILLILCIIFMPRGIVGMLQKMNMPGRRTKAVPAE